MALIIQREIERYKHVYSHKAAQKKEKKNSTKTAVGLYILAYIHQTSGTPNQQLNTACINTVLNILSLV